MSLKTGRFYDCAEVKINKDKCTLCGLCIRVCKGAPLFIEDNLIKVDHNRVFGCIACGQCMTVCPNRAIEVSGRDMTPEDMIEMPKAQDRSTYENLKALMISRRSVRDYKQQNIDKEIIEKILEAAATSPSGLVPSDVEVLVLDRKEKVQEFTKDMVDILKRNAWLISPTMLKIYRPFIGKGTYDSLKTFASVAVSTFIKGYDEGRDWLMYSAPLAIYFHTSPYADPVDPHIPATYAMLAAESLGLGSCMLGTPNILLNYFGKKVKEKYGIPVKNKSGIMVIFGYPDVHYGFALKRRLANIKYY